MCNDISEFNDFYIKSLDSEIIYQAQQWWRSDGNYFNAELKDGRYSPTDLSWCICEPDSNFFPDY